MRVLSLFDGMSCGQIALTELNHDIEYFASEIDKHAILQTQLNFSNTIQLGDVTKWREWSIDWNFDLLLAGSPCQGFSMAGKQLAFDDPRSKLFFVFIDILNHIRTVNPNVKFLLENVRMKAEHEAVITQYVGVNPLYINSALVSAQNRERLYWTNIGMAQKGLFGEWYPDIPQPEDRGILLRYILESEVEEKYYLSDKMIQSLSTYTEGMGYRFQPHDNDTEKSYCLTARYHKQGKSDPYISCVAQRGRGKNNEQQLEQRYDGKSNCLTTVQKDNLVVTQQGCLKFGRSEEGKQKRKDAMKNGIDHTPFQAKKVVDIDYEKMNTLTTQSTKYNLIITHNLQPRSGNGNGGKGHLQKQDGKSYCVDTGNAQAVEYKLNLNEDEKRENQIRTKEILQKLWSIIDQEKNEEWQMAVYARFFKDDILFKRLYENIIFKQETRTDYNKEWQESSTESNANGNVSDMPGKDWKRRSSYRQEPIKQFTRELIASLQELSQQDTQTEKSLFDLWKTPKRIWLLRKALSEIQKIWESFNGKAESILKGSRIRRLTVTECSRLQTIPDWYVWQCSDTQTYKMLGNGWNVETIIHILKYLNK